MAQYATPGVYIEEVTGPGVIAGVGTSTAAFIGPALAGPMGALDELTKRQHSEQSKLFHGDDPFAEPVDRIEFDQQRARYWVTRALEYLESGQSGKTPVKNLYRRKE